jgi:hypothetical protein
MFAQHELLQKPGSGTVCNGMITSSFTRNGTSRTAARSKTSYEIFELKIKMQTCVQLVEFYMYQLVEFHMYQLVEFYMYQLPHNDGHTCVECIECYWKFSGVYMQTCHKGRFRFHI